MSKPHHVLMLGLGARSAGHSAAAAVAELNYLDEKDSNEPGAKAVLEGKQDGDPSLQAHQDVDSEEGRQQQRYQHQRQQPSWLHDENEENPKATKKNADKIKKHEERESTEVNHLMDEDYLTARYQNRLSRAKESSSTSKSSQFCSPIEIAIINCCDTGVHQAEVVESLFDEMTRGANCGHLTSGREERFVAIISQHCHTLADRVLCLAILERTKEHDEVSAARFRKKRKHDSITTEENETVDNSHNSHNDAQSKTSGKNTKLNTDTMSRRKHFDCHKFAKFLSAGGLKVLNQWLADATTPTEIKGRPKPRASHTGPIILPLLSILSSIPFRMDLVKDSQINKQVKKLKKTVEKLIDSFEIDDEDDLSDNSDDTEGTPTPKTLSDFCHPLSGGMPVVAVQESVNELMDTWRIAAIEEKRRSEEESKEGTDSQFEFSQSFKALMRDRLDMMNLVEAGEVPKPSWYPSEPTNANSEAESKESGEEVAHRNRMKEKAAASAAAAKRERELKRRIIESKEQELKAVNAARSEAEKRAKEKSEGYRRKIQEENVKRKTEEQKKKKTTERTQQMTKVTWADSNPKAKANNVEWEKVFVYEDEYAASDEEEKNEENISEANVEESDLEDEGAMFPLPFTI